MGSFLSSNPPSVVTQTNDNIHRIKTRYDYEPKFRKFSNSDRELLISAYAHIEIPNEIIHLCCKYYGQLIQMEFKTNEYITYSLKFSNYNQTVTHKGGGWETCVFGPTINSNDCQLFNLYFDIKNSRNLYVGFSKSSTNSSLSIGWKYPLNHWQNDKLFVAIYISDSPNNYHPYFKDRVQFKSDDSFLFSFDFRSDSLIIYRNNKFFDDQEDININTDSSSLLDGDRFEKLAVISLRNQKEILPAFSLCNKEQQIIVTKYEFKG